MLETSREEREQDLYNQIKKLMENIYRLEEEVKSKDIQLSLWQRKRQHSTNEVIEKKDQEIKVQKMLYKTLSEKYLKIQD